MKISVQLVNNNGTPIIAVDWKSLLRLVHTKTLTLHQNCDWNLSKPLPKSFKSIPAFVGIKKAQFYAVIVIVVI